MSALVIIEVVLLVVVGLMLFYLNGLSIVALFARLRPVGVLRVHRKFAVVVPAHNEEAAIERTIRSLQGFDYPQDRFSVIVVADNCTDRTADTVRALGARVMERYDEAKRGKGHALRWCFERLLTGSDGFDAYVVIDADSTASAQFLQVMNGELERGAKVIQCKDVVEPQPGAWSAEMTRIGFLLYNHVRPLARRVLGLSAGLRGNGMCFAAEVLRNNPWSAYSINEDLEYGLQLLLRGIPVSFAAEATVLATMPRDPKNARSQRARWEGGRFPVIRAYAWPLLRTAVSRPSVQCLDAFVDLVIPALVNLIGFSLLMALVSLALTLPGILDNSVFILLWLVCVFLGFSHMIVGLAAARADRSAYAALVHLPRYAVWKLLVYAGMARHRTKDEWIRTARETKDPPSSPLDAR